MAHAYPLGLQQLNSLNEVKVKQKPSGFNGNKYDVLTTSDELILHAKEKGSFLLGGSERSFHMDLHDVQDTLIFSLRRPFTFGADKMEVSMNGAVVCVVRQQQTFFKPVLHINDAADRLVLRIKGDHSKWDYQLQTSDKKQIGSINKKHGGFWKEVFTARDTYLVRFPADLDARYKAAAIGCCVLIDFLHHES